MATGTFLYPSSDIYVNLWSVSPSGSHWAAVDENTTTLDSTNYVSQSSADTIATITFGVRDFSSIPKSCGFELSYMKFSAREQSSGDTTALNVGIRKGTGGSWYMPLGFSNLTTTQTWYTKVPNFTCTAVELDGARIRISKGYYDLKEQAAGHDRCHVYAFFGKGTIHYDTAAPSPPASIKIAGVLIPAQSSDMNLAPTLSFKYVDNTNASYGNYDETSWVQWQIGTGASGTRVIGTLIDTGQYATLASINAYVIIPWTAATQLAYNIEYYVRCRAADANSNVGDWSSLATFQILPGTPTWWNSDYTRRARISFGTNHSELPKGYTVSLPFPSGVVKNAASNGFLNEAIQTNAEPAGIRYGDRTYFTWRGSLDITAYITYFNHATSTFGPVVAVASIISDSPKETIQLDTHYYPNVIVDGTGRLIVVTSGHHSNFYAYRGLDAIDAAHNGITGGFTGSILVGRGTYPRLTTLTNGNVVCLYRGDDLYTVRYRQYWPTTTPTGWKTEYVMGYYSDPIFSHPPFPTSNFYIGGIGTTVNKFHAVLSYNEVYYFKNKPRGFQYTYSNVSDISDAFATFYSLKGTIMGYSTTNISTASNIKWASGGIIRSSPNFTSISASLGPYYGSNHNGFRTMPSGTVLISSTLLDSQTTSGTLLYSMIWIEAPGKSWTEINISAQFTPTLRTWGGRYGGNVCSFTNEDNGKSYIEYWDLMYPTATQRDDRAFSSEIVKFYSTDTGNSWDYSQYTKNSGRGFPMVSTPPKAYGASEVFLSRFLDIDYFNGSPLATAFLFTGDDIRVTYGTRQIDRLPLNYFNYDSTVLQFSLQATISANVDSYDYYINFGNYFALATPPRNVDNIYPFYENWESYSSPAYATHLHGWQYSGSNTAMVGDWAYLGHVNKISAGFQACRINGSGILYRNIPTVGNYFNISFTDFTDYSFPAVGHLLLLNTSNYDPIATTNFGFEDGDLTPWTAINSAEINTTKVDDGTYSAKIPFSNTVYNGLISTLINFPSCRKITFSCRGIASLSAGDLLAGKGFKLCALDTNFGTVASLFISNVIWSTSTISCSGTVNSNYYFKFILPTLSSPVGKAVFVDNCLITDVGSLWIEFSTDQVRSSKDPETWFSASSYDVGEGVYFFFDMQYNSGAFKQYVNGNLVNTVQVGNVAFSTMKFICTELGSIYDNRYLDYIIVTKGVPTLPSPIATEMFIKDYRATTLISSIIDLAYIRAKRINMNMVSDKEVVDHIAQHLILEFTTAKRISEIIYGERVGKERLASLLHSDKTLKEQLSIILSTDKALRNRFNTIVDGDKKLSDRLAAIIVGDKHVHEVLASTIEGEKTGRGHIAQLTLGDKALIRNIVSEISGDKEVIDSIAIAISGNKEVREEISSIMLGNKLIRRRIEQILLGDKALLSRIVALVQGDKELHDRIGVMMSLERTEQERLSMLSVLDRILINRILTDIRADKHLSTTIISNISVDKTVIVAIGNKILADKVATKEIESIILGNKISIFRMAYRVLGDKEKAERVANSAVLEDTLYDRIINDIILDKVLTSRVASILRTNKELKRKITNIIPFASYSISQYVEEVSFEKQQDKRISEFTEFLATKIYKMAASALFEATNSRLIAESIDIEKILVDSKFSQFADMMAIKISMFAQDTDFIKDFYRNFAETISMEYTNIDTKVAELIDFMAHEMFSFAEDISLLAEKMRSIAQTIDFSVLATSSDRYAAIAYAIKTMVIAVAEYVLFEKDGLGKFAEASSFVKYVQNRLAQVIDFEQFTAYRIAGDTEFLKTIIENFAETVILEKTIFSVFAEDIILQKTLTSVYSGMVDFTATKMTRLSSYVTFLSERLFRLAEDADFSKALQTGFSEYVQFDITETLSYRLGQWTEFEKQTYNKLSEFVTFIKTRLPILIYMRNVEASRSHMSTITISDSDIENLGVV